MEYVEELASQVQEAFAARLGAPAMGPGHVAGMGKIIQRCGNGSDGWPEEAPFDAVIVTAAPQSVPPKLIEQLRDGGRMVVPVGWVYSVQELLLITKKGDGITQEDLLPVRFVPMVGEPG
jgi:protein-L-isoaspartate(D-aspartate) O-methyltransferase